MSTALPRARVLSVYVAIAFLAATIALAGFWPSYFGRVVAGTVDAPLAIHVHAVVFSGWLALLVLQATLAAQGKIALHQRLGRYFFLYAAVVILAGLLVAFHVFFERVDAGQIAEAKRGLFVPITDLLVLAPVLFAAWLYRSKPETHKRLIVVATTVLLIAASHRLIVHNMGMPPPLVPVLLVWLSPIAVGMAYDAVTRRMMHPVYAIGIALVFALKFRPQFQKTEAWDVFTSWLARMAS